MFYAYVMSNKVIILVANSKKYPSNIVIPHIKNTWFKDSPYDVFFYQGESNDVKIKDSHIFLHSSSKYMDMGKKFIECLEVIDKKFEYEYIFKTTTGSYINFQNFEAFVNNLPEKNLCCAPVGLYPPSNRTQENQISFGSGRGIFLSRDVVKRIIEESSEWDHSLYDDVALGKFLFDRKIKIKSGYRQDFNFFPTLNEFNFNNYHYGFRLDTSGIPRFLEILSIYSIRSKLKYFNDNKKFQFLIIKITDFIFTAIFKIIFFINIKHQSKNYKLKMNSLLEKLYKKLKKSKTIYNILKFVKNKLNIRTSI